MVYLTMLMRSPHTRFFLSMVCFTKPLFQYLIRKVNVTSNSLVKRSPSHRSIFPFHEPMDKPFITKSINSHSLSLYVNNKLYHNGRFCFMGLGCWIECWTILERFYLCLMWCNELKYKKNRESTHTKRLKYWIGNFISMLRGNMSVHHEEMFEVWLNLIWKRGLIDK